MPLSNQANRLSAAERRAETIILRRQGLTLQAIADRLGVSYACIQKDLNKYLKRLDEECTQNAAALRAEEFERLQKASEHLDQQVFEEGETLRINELLKVSESKRRLYALDVVPIKKAEVTHRKEITVQLISTLRAELPAHIFGEVLNCLTRSDEFGYLGGSVEASSAEGNPPDQSELRRITAETCNSTTNSPTENLLFNSSEATDFVDISE